MKKTTIALLIALFITLCFAHGAVGAEDTLPADAQKLVAKCDDDISKSRKLLIVALVKAQDKATKSGNLAAANAIKAKIDETAKLVGETGDLLGGMKEGPVGSYKVSNTAWGVTKITLADKGIARASNGDSATWKLDKEGMLIVTWYNGNVNKGKFSAGTIDMQGESGSSFTMERE